MSRAVLFDTETTGLDPLTGDRVLEIACIELMNDLATGRTYHSLIHPQRDIPEEAARIHGIRMEQLRDAPRFEEIAADLMAFFGDGPLIAHNAAFDFGFINAEFARMRLPALDPVRMVDTLAMAKKRFPGMPNSLDALCRRFGIDLSGRSTHNALLDCKLLAEVYVELTGGRQRGLGLDPSKTAGAERPLVHYAASGAPRTPRPIVPTEAQRQAHDGFVARLKAPIWNAG